MKLWHLLKGELTDNRWRLVMSVVIGFLVTSYTLAVLPEEDQPFSLMLILLLTSFVAAQGGERVRLRDKLDRRDQLLPLPARQRALSRLLFPFVCYLFVLMTVLVTLSLWPAIFHTPVKGFNLTQWFTVNGMLAVVIGAGRCFSDLRGWTLTRRSRNLLWAFWKGFAMLLLLPFYLLTVSSLQGLNQAETVNTLIGFLNSLRGGLMLNVAGLFLLGLGFYLNLTKPSHANP